MTDENRDTSISPDTSFTRTQETPVLIQEAHSSIEQPLLQDTQASTSREAAPRSISNYEDQRTDSTFSTDWTIPENSRIVQTLPPAQHSSNLSGGTDNNLSEGEKRQKRYQRKFLKKQQKEEKILLKHQNALEEQRRRKANNPPPQGFQHRSVNGVPLSDLCRRIVSETPELGNHSTPQNDTENHHEMTGDDNLQESSQPLVACDNCSCNTGVLENKVFTEDVEEAQKENTSKDSEDPEIQEPEETENPLLENFLPKEPKTPEDDEGEKALHSLPSDGEQQNARLVTITVGRTQVQQSVDLDPEYTVVHAKVYNDHIMNLRAVGQSCKAYQTFKDKSKSWQKAQRKHITVQGKCLEVIGPFPILIQVDAVTINTEAFITSDDDFGKQFIISGDIWRPAQVTSIRTIGKKCEEKVEMDKDCHTRIQIKNFSIKALIDTGAGPSVMSSKIYRQVGGNMKDLQEPTVILSAANKTKIEVCGLTPPMQFKIGESTFTMQFNLVDNLSGSVILGRDYLTMYDVLVDMMRRKLIIRNPEKKYDIHEHLIDTRRRLHVGSMIGKIETNAKGMKVAEFQVQPRRKQSAKQDDTPWLACIQAKHSYQMEEHGMRIAKTIAIVRNNRVHAPILSIGTTDHSTNPKHARIRITEAKVEYTRKNCDEPTKDSCQAIELREKLREDNSILTGLSISSDGETLETRTNFPLEEFTPSPEPVKKKEFQLRPDLGKLKDQLT